MRRSRKLASLIAREARPAHRADPIVRPQRFCRTGLTKEAHDGRSISQTELLHGEQSEAWGNADRFGRGFHECRRAAQGATMLPVAA
jgi:hypothetical protein